jgi:hypothetical protein
LVSNAQGWRVFIIDVRVGAVYAVVWRPSRKRKDMTKLSLPPKLVENLI